MNSLLRTVPALLMLAAMTLRADEPKAAVDAAPAATPAKPAARPPGKAGARAGAPAHDRLDLDTTSITGNRELPKVMVIVPWKKSDIGDLVGKPVNSLIDEALQPVDREVFRREIEYHAVLDPERPRREPAKAPFQAPVAPQP
jgi:hypothetical protein